MTPFYEIRRLDDGQSDWDAGDDITGTLKPFIKRIKIHDYAGSKSDAIVIDMADDGTVALPKHGTRLALRLGYMGQKSRVRTQMTVDQYVSSGPPAQISLSATGADFTSEMREPRDRTHPAMTLASLLSRLAGNYEVDTQVLPDSLAQLQLPLIDQAGQSDLGLAAELAETYGAIFKPVNGKWVIMGYDALPDAPIAVKQSDVTDWEMHFAARRHSPTVVAYWQDNRSAKRIRVQVGSGQPPTSILDKTFDSEAVARANAQARLYAGIRQASRGRLTLPGQPALQSLTVLPLQGFRDKIDGKWLISRVTHTLDKNGYTSMVGVEAMPGASRD